MLFESEEFGRGHKALPPDPAAGIYRFCTFDELEIDGAGLEGALISCTLRKVDWYWGLFSTADILHTSFENCVFRGTSFRGCHFGDCTFTECDFLRDNLDSACTFADCAIAECQFDRCEFEPAHEGSEPLFAKVRWLACTQWRCTGLEGLF